VATRHGRRRILLAEALFTVALALFVGIRVLNPDLWQPWFGGEKMMEIAFLNAVSKSGYMPPYDPYFAGGYINYYYYGQFLASLLGKLSGARPEVGFNLSVATVFALTVSHAYGLGHELTRRLRARSDAVGATERACVRGGLLSALFVALIGNLTGVTQLFDRLASASGAAAGTPLGVAIYWQGLINVVSGRASLGGFDYWYSATRVIPYTINEFPFFSFLFADLHPHMIAIPFTILALAISLEVGRWAARSGGDASRRHTLALWVCAVICLGALGIINTWDLPTFWGILGACLLYGGWSHQGKRGLARSLAMLLLFALASVLAYAPFYGHYRAQYVGLGWVPLESTSPLGPFAAIWGLLGFVALSQLLVWLLSEWPWGRLLRAVERRGWGRLWRHLPEGVLRRNVIAAMAGLLICLLGLALGAVAVSSGRVVLGMALPLLVAAGVVLPCAGGNEARFLRRLMLFVGLGIWAGVEIIYMRDWLADMDWRRMNTVFKFYTQAWVLLAIVGGVSLPALWRRAGRGYLVAWRGVCALLLIGSLVYTIEAPMVRVNERFVGANASRGTLDGTAYMQVASYAWPDAESHIQLRYDREAIAWLWQNVEGTPILLEASLGYYREGGLRVASYTGLPTLVGMHEREQRPADQVAGRETDVARMYNTTDISVFESKASEYGIRYVYVGQLERAVYADQGLEKFEQMVALGRATRAYSNAKTVIYELPAVDA